jgi:long-chain acyl-CoA synthetase
MLYTAAFDGKPNGALLSQTAMLWQSLTWGATHDFTFETVYLASEPMFHVAGLMNLIGTFHRGGTNVFERRIGAEEICHLIEAEHCTTAYFVDKTINEIVELDKDRKYDLKSLRSPQRNPEWNAMVTLGTSAWDKQPGGYGQTETMGMLTYNALGSRPLPGVQARVIDGEGNDLPAGDVGELVARGPTPMNGYFQRADLNARRQHDEWHHTNDLALRETDGSLTWLGSMDRIIKSGSENVYPAEVEACIKSHPEVIDCAVTGILDASWGQTVKATVVTAPGATTTEEDIFAYCRRRIATYKTPRILELIRSMGVGS